MASASATPLTASTIPAAPMMSLFSKWLKDVKTFTTRSAQVVATREPNPAQAQLRLKTPAGS